MLLVRIALEGQEMNLIGKSSLIAKKNTLQKKWILAGGLGLDNAKEAYNILRPEIMDFNSAIELEPGQKDHQKLDSLFTILRP